RLDEEHVAARAGHGQAGRDAGHGRTFGRLLPEALPAEGVAQLREVDRNRRLRVAGSDPSGRLAEELAEFALELPDSRLAGLLGDDRLDDVVGDLDLVLAEAVALALPRPEVALGDRDLLVDRVAVEADHLHAV